MKKRNTSNNPLFREVRELEEKCMKAGKIGKDDIRTSEEMRASAWNIYLTSYGAHLKTLLAGGAQ